MSTKPMPVPTRVCYFNLTGLGESVRFMLAYCSEKFIDDRMTREEFAERKDSFPYGKVPYLEIDGLFLHQSIPICRYLAQKHGLTGKNSTDAIQADIMVDTVKDVFSGLVKYYYEEDESAKEKKKEPVFKETDYYLDRLEKAVQLNGGYLVKGQLTWADIAFAGMTFYMNFMAGKDLFTTRPALQSLKEKICALPKIKQYMDNRPEHPC